MLCALKGQEGAPLTIGSSWEISFQNRSSHHDMQSLMTSDSLPHQNQSSQLSYVPHHQIHHWELRSHVNRLKLNLYHSPVNRLEPTHHHQQEQDLHHTRQPKDSLVHHPFLYHNQYKKGSPGTKETLGLNQQGAATLNNEPPCTKCILFYQSSLSLLLTFHLYNY